MWPNLTLPPQTVPPGQQPTYWTELTVDGWGSETLNNAAWSVIGVQRFTALLSHEWAVLPLNDEKGEIEMLQGSYALVLSACGVSIQTNVLRSAKVGIEPVDTDLPAGKAGTLGTRTDNDTGIATLEQGHGVQQGDKVDVYDSHGSVVRYGMDVTNVAGNDVTLDAGSGDALPAQGASIVVSVQQSIDVTFDGDNLVLIGGVSRAP